MENVKSVTLSVSRRKSLLKRIFTCWELYIFLIPALLETIIFKYWPMYGLQLAFKELLPGKSITASPWVGLKHFERFFALPNCWQLIWTTFKTSFFTTLVGFPIPIIFALMLNQVRNERCKKLIQNISYMPYLFSVVVVISMVNVLLAPNTGVVNIIIQKLGGEQILFFGHEKYVLPIWIITNLWQTMGYSAIIYIAALAGIDQEQMEAARIDGASRFKIIWHIEIPAIMETIMIQMILSFGRMFSIGVDKMLLLQTPLNLASSEIISTYVYKVGLLQAQFGFSTAVNLFNTAVNLACLLIVNGIAKKVSDSSLF